MSFALHPDLVRDTAEVTRLALCRVGLRDDANFPWLILSPMLPGLRDFHDVPAAHHGALMDEIGRASRALQQIYDPDKINVAALGNVRIETLVVAADPSLDAALGAEAAERVAGLLPHGQLVTIPGARHAVHASKPRELTRAVRQFLAL